MERGRNQIMFSFRRWIIALSIIVWGTFVCTHVASGQTGTMPPNSAVNRNLSDQKTIQADEAINNLLENIHSISKTNESLIETPRLLKSEDGYLRSLGAPPNHYFQVTSPIKDDPVATARNFLIEHGKAFGITSKSVGFETLKTKKRDQRSYIRLQQTYAGIPVFGAEIIIQLNSSGGVESVLSDIMNNTDVFDRGIVSVVPSISKNDARQIAINVFVDRDVNSGLKDSAPILTIYDPPVIGNQGAPLLVWKTTVTGEKGSGIDDEVFVDAQSGEVVLHYSLIRDFLYRKIYDDNNTISPPLLPDRKEGDPPDDVADVNRAYNYLGDAYSFYFNNHGRDSINGAGMSLIAYVRYCSIRFASCPWPGAEWRNNEIHLGNGFAADDVVGHEFTHGITDYESNLKYLNQSGAIDESFSDIWGEFIDLANGRGTDTPEVKWLLGEDTSIGAKRNMKDPPNPPSPAMDCSGSYNSTLHCRQPDKMGGQYWYMGSDDNGGVHINCGVGNKLVYLLTDGDTFNGHTINGMGISKVADLFYEVQTNLLPSAADYTDLCEQLIRSAINLNWSSPERLNVERACLAVKAIDKRIINENTWAKIYGGSGNDYAYSIQQTFDGGFILAGATSSFGAGEYDFWVLKLDSNGNTEWQKTYGGTGHDVATFINQTKDGGYIATGWMDYCEGWVLKLSIDGTIQWQKNIGSLTTLCYATSPMPAQETTDGGFIIGGFEERWGDYYSWLLKLNKTGDKEWWEYYPGHGILSMEKTLEGNFILSSYLSGGWIGKANIDGNILWQKIYPDGTVDYVQQTPDGGYIAAGLNYTNNYSGDVWALKLDSTGNILWQKIYGLPLYWKSFHKVYSIKATIDGGYIVNGRTNDYYSDPVSTGWLMKLDDNGNVQWISTVAGNYDEYPGRHYDEPIKSIQQTLDGGYITAGTTSYYGTSGYDILVMKLGADGNIDVPCGVLIGTTYASASETNVSPSNSSATVRDRNATLMSTSVIPVNTDAVVTTKCFCASPGRPSLGSPSNGATGVSTTPTLNWSDVSEATSYDVRVCSDSNCSTVVRSKNVTNSQWTVSPALNEGTTYYWRVRSKNSCGTSLWTNIRSFTTCTNIPSRPSLGSPSNGATGISTTPILNWGDVSGAISYDVRVCSDSTCSSVVRSKNVTNSQWTVSPALSQGTTYYWRVRSKNSCGTSSWSNIRSFTTCTNIPGRPSLVSPSNGATGVSTTPKLDWGDVSGATSYDVQVCRDSVCATVVRSKNVTISEWSMSPALAKGITYYWRVRSVNACGESAWSGIRKFTTSGS